MHLLVCVWVTVFSLLCLGRFSNHRELHGAILSSAIDFIAQRRSTALKENALSQPTQWTHHLLDTACYHLRKETLWDVVDRAHFWSKLKPRMTPLQQVFLLSGKNVFLVHIHDSSGGETPTLDLWKILPSAFCDSTNVFIYYVQQRSLITCQSHMLNAETHLAVEISTHQAGSSTEVTGAWLRCHLTSLLRLWLWSWTTTGSNHSLREFSAIWLNAHCWTSNTMTFLQLRSRHLRGLTLLRIFFWTAISFQFFLQDCSKDWAIWRKLSWIITKYHLLMDKPLEGWNLCRTSVYISTKFHLYTQSYLLACIIWGRSTWDTMLFLPLKQEHSKTWTLFRPWICPKTKYQFYLQEYSLDWVIWMSLTWQTTRFQSYSKKCF